MENQLPNNSDTVGQKEEDIMQVVRSRNWRLIPRITYHNWKSNPDVPPSLFDHWFRIERRWNGRIIYIICKGRMLEFDFRQRWWVDIAPAINHQNPDKIRGLFWGNKKENGVWIATTSVEPLALFRQMDAWYFAIWKLRIRIMKPWGIS